MSTTISNSDISIDHQTKNFTTCRCHVCNEMKLNYEIHGIDSFSTTKGRMKTVNLAEEGCVPQWVQVPIWRTKVVDVKYICNDCHAKKVPEVEHRHFSRPATIPAGDCTAEQKLKWLEALQEMKDAFGEQVLILADVSTPSGEWATKAAIRLGIHIKHQEGVSA